MSIKPSLIAIAAASALATPTAAQQGSAPPADTTLAQTADVDLDRDTVTIGGGIGFVPSYEGSNDYVVIPAGAIRGRYKGFNFSSRGLQLSVDLVRDDGPSGVDFELGPVVSLNLNRTSRIVDPQVRALGTRRIAFEAGGFAGIAKTGVLTSAYDRIGVRVTYVHDVTDVHGSYLLIPSIEYGTPLSRRAYVGISGSATIAGDGYARTYFAVDPAGQAASGLPLFADPRGGLKNYSASMLASYSLSGDLTHGLGLFALGSYSRLQGDFARSPVVSVAGSPNQWYGAVGIGYTF